MPRQSRGAGKRLPEDILAWGQGSVKRRGGRSLAGSFGDFTGERQAKWAFSLFVGEIARYGGKHGEGDWRWPGDVPRREQEDRLAKRFEIAGKIHNTLARAERERLQGIQSGG